MKRFLLAGSGLIMKKQYASLFLSGFFLIAVLSACNHSFAQSSNSDYIKTITDRSAKIVNTLGIVDSALYNHTVQLLVNQYSGLNDVYAKHKEIIAAAKAKGLSADELAAQTKQDEELKATEIQQLHDAFITGLSKSLSEEQVEQVKDGMTYRVFPITYAAYQDELPQLTMEQKAQIYAWLKEAREKAMDAESSEKKHAVFGKYKGKINNYLSAAGYDMKKAGEEWQERIKEREAAKIWSAAGGYAPTVGILGAVLGLIHVMENLSDPAKIGSGIAVAFVATIYGVALANLVFLPISNKLKGHIQHEMSRREMLLNAWVSIARGDNPKLVSERLESYLHLRET